MKKCVCKINEGIGIFAKVKYENEINTILITNENIINEKEINCELYNNNKKRIIIDNERNKYNDNNIQIVEIKPDIDKINDYIEIDDNINNNKYNNKNIYIIENNNNDIIISYNIYNNQSPFK